MPIIKSEHQFAFLYKRHINDLQRTRIKKMQDHYKIYEISVIRLLSLADECDGGYIVPAEIPELIKEHIAEETLQNNCPVFYQILKIIEKNNRLKSEAVLESALIYLDFSGIYDRKPSGKIIELQEKADKLFSPAGLQLDFGIGPIRFLAFERSASMSRNCRLSFVREDVYEILKEHMMLGMKIGNCQLSKLYAYNGLMFSDGHRFETIDLSEKRIIIVDNPVSIVKDVDIVTVRDDGSDGALRKYTRSEETADIEVLEYDGEGIISSEWARSLNLHNEGHHSFQIRLPYIKGVVHEVDFKNLYEELGITIICDIFGTEHKVADVEMILTKSMFKGFAWMQENEISWSEYLDRCRKYDHAFYVSGMDKTEKSNSTELNYQFLNTLAFTEEEFRPKDLPLGWNVPPENDSRIWITKTTEETYYKVACDAEWRIRHFTDELDGGKWDMEVAKRNAVSILKKNRLFINEKIYTDELDDLKNSIAEKYSSGKLIVFGDNRYLSDDLVRLLAHVAEGKEDNIPGIHRLEDEMLQDNEMYAPGATYPCQDSYTLLRSPHIARNEEAVAVSVVNAGYLRTKYLSHLTYVLMVDSKSLIPERLGGADYDGDMVKTIADPLVNRCVLRNYENEKYLPLLKIPAAEPVIADASDWQARLACIKNTFSSRVGQISNAALNCGILAYDENTDAAKRDQYRKDTETLAILTGLEIDSAKSGIKPDLTEYLTERKAPRSLFLKYNSIVRTDESDRKWFQPTKKEKLKKYFASEDWQQNSSNLEKLPFYAKKLAEQTPGIKSEPQPDEVLFTFAQEPGWKEKRDPVIMDRMKSVIKIYEDALKRVLISRHQKTGLKRKNDVERILYSRGQDEDCSVEELYALFEYTEPRYIHEARRAINNLRWHLTPPEERKEIYWKITGHLRIPSNYEDLFCDFRHCGFRLLGDILCDIDENNRIHGSANGLAKHNDNKDMATMLLGVENAPDYRQRINFNCLMVLQPIDHKDYFDFEESAKCAIALGKRKFAIDVLGTYLEPLIVADRPKKKKWREFGK